MGKLLWFNPQNDLALASNISHFTPPANAYRLATSGQLLPMWFGEAGDMVLTYRPIDKEWVTSMKAKFDRLADIYVPCVSAPTECEPWGWSRDAKSRFLSAGVDSSLLPGDEDIDAIRQLSHRRISKQLMSKLRGRIHFALPPDPKECKTLDGCIEAIELFDGRVFVKLPYSSTGRGVVNISGLSREQIAERVSAMMRRQGSVMIEKALDKLRDFAMLFRAEKEGVRFIGYSAFEAENGVAYSGNLIMSDSCIRNMWIGSLVDVAELDQLEVLMPQLLHEIIGGRYRGYLGVDMMVYSDGGVARIAPCVEVNLRMTMGVVSHIVGRRFLHPELTGRLSVLYNQGLAEYAPVIENGRLVSGTLPLTEPGGQFTIALSVSE